MHVVLVEPEIAPNTGNVARLCAATRSTLHLIEPLGFRLDDRQLRRAGMDYWQHVAWHRWPDWPACEQVLAGQGARCWFVEQGGPQHYAEVRFEPGDALVFGRETAGLPRTWLDARAERWLRLPMFNPEARSLNLANCVAVVLYEALRQAGFVDEIGPAPAVPGDRTRPPLPSVTIRRAVPADVLAITDIYNEAILTTTATFDTEPKSVEERTAWLQAHDQRHPVLVAEVEGRVVGWACLTRWSDRCAYDDTAETSFYVHSTHRGRGIGRCLKDAIIAEARRLRYHTLLARVAEGSRESLYLNQRAGFVHVGTLKEVGLKFGRRLDVHILQLRLAPPQDRNRA